MDQLHKFCGAFALTALLTMGLVNPLPVRAQEAISEPPDHFTTQQGGGGPERLPADLRTFLQRAERAANTHDPTGLQALGAPDLPPDAFAWTRDVATKTWQAAAARIPGSPDSAPIYLAVFHAWHGCESDGDHVHRLQRSGPEWQLSAEIPETDPGGFRVRDHHLRITLQPAQHTATIADDVKIERLPDAPAPFALLRLSDDFRVRTLQRDGKPVAFAQAGGIVALAAPPGKTFTLTLRYDGVVNHAGSAYIHQDEAVLAAYFYPHTARLPATATVTVTAPPGWIPLAQGEKQTETRAADGAITVTYRNDVPTCYFTVDAGKYRTTTRNVGGVALTTYLLQDNPALAQRSLNTLERALRFYQRQFGPYPYTRYGLVETRGPLPGALEAYSFATYGMGTLNDTIAHELAHTWWGGLIPCTYTRSLWNEAFAMYSDDLFQRSERATSPFPVSATVPAGQWRAQRQNYGKFGNAFDTVPLAAAHDTSDGRQAVVGYEKGRRVLRALEAEIGQPKMLAAMRRFLSAHPRGEAAEWADFERVVGTVMGTDYHWFFAQWLERTGLPQIQVSDWRVTENDPGFVLETNVTQTGAPYRLSLPIRIETRDGKVHHTTVQIEGATSSVRISLPQHPARIVLDPDDTLPLALPTGGAGDPFTFDLPDD